MPFYDEDLARIQASDYGGVAEEAAPGIIRRLKRAGVRGGPVLDLGCGAGPLARALGRAGYSVSGIEGSRALARIAKAQAPAAKVSVGNIHTALFPKSVAVCAVGEVLQYMPAGRAQPSLPRLFDKAYRALRPDGLILFDLIVEPMVPVAQSYQARGDGWEIEIGANQTGPILRRELVITRGGKTSRETHCQYIYGAAQIAQWMRQSGFRTDVLDSYGVVPILPRRKVFMGQKV
ncbi:MAG: class I SAM-dependent methyltransferase, partial [Alphaproteobacteria bacterium]